MVYIGVTGVNVKAVVAVVVAVDGLGMIFCVCACEREYRNRNDVAIHGHRENTKAVADRVVNLLAPRRAAPA